METKARTSINVEALVKAPIDKVWTYWSEPKHIMQWNQASPDWHTPYADNDLRKEGKFKSTMAAKDGSVSFDFEGEYTNVQHHQVIEYRIADGRTVKIIFETIGNETTITETFEAEDTNPIEMQRGGWQAIMNSFKTYTETN
jgi:uncharacterized protein YndB with AHSA1/START domain